MRLTERDRLDILALGREALGDSRVWASTVLARLQRADDDVLDAGLHVFNPEQDALAPLVKDRQPFTEAITSLIEQLDGETRRRLFLGEQPEVWVLREVSPDHAWAAASGRLLSSGASEVIIVTVPLSSAGGFALALGLRRAHAGDARHRASVIELVAQLAGQFAAQRVLDRGSICDVAPRPTLDALDAVLSGSLERLSLEPASEGFDLVERMLDEGWAVLHIGRRGVVAVRVGGEHTVVTADDRAVVLMAAGGHSNDEIACALGTSASTTAQRLRMNLKRLGVTDRHQLACLVAMASGPLARASEVVLGNTSFLVVTFDVAHGHAHLDERLTNAEKAVTALAVVGLSNAEIAGARGVSERTIANQLAAIYRKLGVSSRFELAASFD
jgi:DNA-binding CsgD family transcriptional regulator